MAKRSTIDTLPQAARDKVNKALVEGGFADYEALADGLTAALRSAGYELTITRSTLHRYGQKFAKRLEALERSTQMARAVVEASPDDEATLNDALIRIVQHQLFEALGELEIGAESLPSVDKIARAVAELGKATVSQKLLAAKVREKLVFAADVAEERVRAKGLSQDAIEELRRAILGVEAI